MLLSTTEASLLVSVMCFFTCSESAQEIKCKFHARRELVCDVTKPDVTTPFDFNCTICPHFNNYQRSKSIICPNNFPAPNCPVYRGRCEYNCQKHHLCNNGHVVMVTYKGDNPEKPTSFCQYVDTNRLVKPGPVRNLTLTMYRSKLTVTWRKPSDFHADHAIYRYKVECGSSPNGTVKFQSRKDNLEASCMFVKSNTFTVSVRNRPLNHGFWSEPKVAVLQNKAVTRLRVTPSSLTEHNFRQLRESEAEQKIYVDEATIKPMLLAVLGLLTLLCTLIFITAGWIVLKNVRCPSTLSKSDVQAICKHHNLLAEDYDVITVRPTWKCFSSRVSPFKTVKV